jgi:hypothetical protein
MSVEQHEKLLHQMGLDDEDIEEWEEATGIDKPGKKPKKGEKSSNVEEEK